MALTQGGCRNISHLQEDEKVVDAFSKLISGKSNYKTIIEKDKPVIKCKNCGKILTGEEKFCPECGTKVEESKN
jgi:rRNA maturation endonuclease Nob1